MTRSFALIAAVLLLRGTQLLASDVAFPDDPRVVLANSLLDDENEWSSAIELYEEVLAENPNHIEARDWLARVLSWRGDYERAFVHFDALLSHENPPSDTRIERAEVLSWPASTLGRSRVQGGPCGRFIESARSPGAYPCLLLVGPPRRIRCSLRAGGCGQWGRIQPGNAGAEGRAQIEPRNPAFSPIPNARICTTTRSWTSLPP